MNEGNSLTCLVCNGPVVIALTKKGNGLHFKCEKDGRHFRGFVMDKQYLQGVMRHAESLTE